MGCQRKCQLLIMLASSSWNAAVCKGYTSVLILSNGRPTQWDTVKDCKVSSSSKVSLYVLLHSFSGAITYRNVVSIYSLQPFHLLGHSLYVLLSSAFSFLRCYGSTVISTTYIHIVRAVGSLLLAYNAFTYV